MKEDKVFKRISTLSLVFHFYIPKDFRIFDTEPGSGINSGINSIQDQLHY
jgi:hypothetical protein